MGHTSQLSSANPDSLRPMDSREAKFLSSFITIRNASCNTGAATSCLTRQDCTAQGGTASGLCLLGLGVCCVVVNPPSVDTTPTDETVCGGTAVERITRFTMPDLYSTPGDCKLIVPLVSDNICQLKVEFNEFELSPPDIDGKCDDDYFKISGSVNDAIIPTLCGDNKGRHVYADVDPVLGTPALTIFLGANNADRSWDITITQIDCNDVNRAPAGCLQYYTEQSGTIQSFNYKSGLTSLSNANTHLANLDYGACIASRGYCKVSYSKTDKYSFLLSEDPVDLSGAETDHDDDFFDNNIAPSNDCNTDYVVIPQGTYANDTGNDTSADRFCGVTFPPKVTSTAGPFVLYVKMDGKETDSTDAYNNGFSLDYVLSEEC